MKDKKIFLQKKDRSAVISAIITSIAFMYYFDLSTANVFPLVMILPLFYLYKNAYSLQKSRKTGTASNICALFYAVSMLPARSNQILLSGAWGIITAGFYLTVFFIMFRSLLSLLYSKLLNVNITGTERKKGAVIVFLCFTLIFMLSWLPYFLYVYPADITQDSYDQIMQAIGGKPLSDHHPVVHTLLIKRILMFGMLVFHNDVTKSLALYTVCQSLFLAMSFSYCLTVFYKMGINKLIIAASALFYIIPAYHGFYSAEMWKDIWFTAFTVFFSVTVWRIVLKISGGSKKISPLDAVIMFISGLGLCLFRSNGLFAFVLFFIFSFVYSVKNKIRSLPIMCSVILLITFIVKVPLYNAMGITRPDILESLAIPIQQVSAVITEGRELTEEQTALINNAVDIAVVPSKYKSYLCDPVKFAIRDKNGQEYISAHKGEFFKLWLELGLKYPTTYIGAYVNQTCGYWDTDVQAPLYYPIHGTFNNPFKQSVLPKNILNIIAAYSELYKHIPYVGLLWSIGMAVWTMFFLFGASYVKKAYGQMLVYLPNTGIWLTLLIAAPAYDEFRYMYCLFAVLPLLFTVPFYKKNIE